MRPLIFIFIFFGFSSFIVAQSSYDEGTLKKFVDVHFDIKIEQKEHNRWVDEQVAQEGLSVHQYRKLMQKTLPGNKYVLSAEEKVFVEKVQAIHKKHEKDLTEKVDSVCKNAGLTVATFNEIEQRYKTDIEFQRSLKPIIDEKINTLNSK